MAKAPDEFYYGFEPPPGPKPIGTCKWCSRDIYNEDHIFDGDVLCPECEKVAYKGSTAVDFIIDLLKSGQVGSVVSFLQDNRLDDWTEGFGEYVRHYFEEEYSKWIKF